MQQTTTTANRTAQKLAEMFTANTGKHFLDSGGAYGRNWERNQGMTAEEFLSAPSATWERDYGFTLSSFHYCYNRLKYSKTAEVLTRLMHVWELSDYDNRNLYSLDDQEAYLQHLGATGIYGYNTYNGEENLSQTLQFMQFELFGTGFILLQVHGGCDVRGGYTLPVIFESATDYFGAGVDECSLYCESCEVSGASYDLSTWYRHGDLGLTLFGRPDREFFPPEDYDLTTGCPKCQGDLTAEGMEVN